MADSLISIENRGLCFGRRALMPISQAFVLLLFVKGSGPVHHIAIEVTYNWGGGSRINNWFKAMNGWVSSKVQTGPPEFSSRGSLLRIVHAWQEGGNSWRVTICGCGQSCWMPSTNWSMMDLSILRPGLNHSSLNSWVRA